MKRQEQWGQERSVNELLVALRQLDYNVQAIYAHSRQSSKVQELCMSLHQAAEAVMGWVDLNGRVKIVVAFQPMLIDYDSDDTQYGESPY